MAEKAKSSLIPDNIGEQLSSLPVLIGLVAIIGLMILPVPTVLLDLLLAMSIALSVLILLTAVYVMRPLEFSGLPALLLVATLFRLGLNVASTRLILLGAAEGQADVGKIIETFGHFVVGGNAIVGIIVFLVLVIINFMVITKGAGRIAEVAARFTLDALPGKQMSIDAELAAGALTDEEARTKREEVSNEADFYGAMDGASKFVRGDAIAGLIITGINIVGGLLIGSFQGGLSIGEAATQYTILTVGDGLVSQIPALFISTATGIIVTRVASSRNFSSELGGQLGDPRSLYAGAAVLVLLGLVPGMPFIIFMTMAAVMAGLAYRLGKTSADVKADEPEERTTDQLTSHEVEINDLLAVESVALEIGFGLIGLVDESAGGTLLGRLVQMRKQFASQLGVVVPSIHIRDNMELSGGQYRLMLKGTKIGGGDLMPGRLLAIDPGFVTEQVPGTPTKDPTFGLDALWIEDADRHQAEAVGYTVVDLDTVVTTHVGELLRHHSSELLGWQELDERLEEVRKEAPKLIEELIPDRMSFGDVLSVLRRLVEEGVSIRDLKTILEALAENARGENVSVSALTDEVRARLARQISSSFMDPQGVIHAALLDRGLEDRLRGCVMHQRNEPVLACDLMTAQGLFAEIENALGSFAMKDAEPVILAPPDLRAPLKQFLGQFFPNIDVICHREVVASAQIVSLAQLGIGDDAAQQRIAPAG